MFLQSESSELTEIRVSGMMYENQGERTRPLGRRPCVERK